MFMSIAEHVMHLNVASALYSLEVKPSFLIKKFDILIWKNEMCIFRVVKVLQNWEFLFCQSMSDFPCMTIPWYVDYRVSQKMHTKLIKCNLKLITLINNM